MTCGLLFSTILCATNASLNLLAAQPAGLELVDEQRLPVAGARVRVWLVPRPSGDLTAILAPLCDRTSDDHGALMCVWPEGLQSIIVIDAPGREPVVQRLTSQPTAPLELGAGFILNGRIDEPKGIPADRFAKARLVARVEIDVPELRRAIPFDRPGTVAPDGRLTIPGLPIDPAKIRLDVPGYLPWLGNTMPGQAVHASLKPGVALIGKVLDRIERPIAGARVAQVGVDAPPQSDSDADGRFEISVAALPARLEVSATGYRTGSLSAPASDAPAPLVARLEPGQGVTGVLLTADGRPASHATLSWVLYEEGRSERGQTDVTTRDGSFKVDLDLPGRYSFSVEAPDHRPEQLPKTDLAAGEHIDLGTVRLRAGAGATGTLVDDAEGKAIAGALVELVPQGTTFIGEVLHQRAPRGVSGGDGRFMVAGAAEGAYLLKVRAAGFAESWRKLDLLEDIIEEVGTLALGHGTMVTGTVETRAGSPVAGATVRFFDGEAAGLQPLAEATTDQAGSFAGVTLAPGGYLVRVLRARVVLAQGIEIPKGTKETELELKSPSVRLSGVVLRSGNPVAGGRVVVRDALDPSSRRGKIMFQGGPEGPFGGLSVGLPETSVTASVGAEGRFTIDDASAGVAFATYIDLDGASWSREITVPDQPEAAVVIDLQGETLMGMVKDDRGASLDETEITLISSAGERLASATSGSDGRFGFADLQPGSYGLAARKEGYRSATRVGIRVAHEERGIVTLVLAPGKSGSLSVQLWRSGGRPASWVPITLFDRGGSMVRALPTDSAGEILFSDLPAGGYIVAWSDPLAGVGASGELRIDAETPARFATQLAPGAGVNLHCALPECSTLQLGALQLLTPLGIDIAPLLPVVSPRLRFSADGWFRLGTVSPGSYVLQVLVGGTPCRRELLLNSGETTAEVP